MRSLWPEQITEMTDAQLLERYAFPPETFIRFNFVSSIDGSVSVDGVSAGLGTDADARVFALLRRLCSVVLVGAGTVRAEGYDGELISDADAQWRAEHGLQRHPDLAIVSHGLHVKADDPVFASPPAAVYLFTSATEERITAAGLPEHVRVVRVPEAFGGCSASAVKDALVQRGHHKIHAEGGPRILGQFLAEDEVDSLCLTTSPVAVGGEAGRISNSTAQQLRHFSPHSIILGDSTILTEYRRVPVGSP